MYPGALVTTTSRPSALRSCETCSGALQRGRGLVLSPQAGDEAVGADRSVCVQEQESEQGARLRAAEQCLVGDVVDLERPEQPEAHVPLGL